MNLKRNTLAILHNFLLEILSYFLREAVVLYTYGKWKATYIMIQVTKVYYAFYDSVCQVLTLKSSDGIQRK